MYPNISKYMFTIHLKNKKWYPTRGYNPVVNHSRWFVETLALIASIYLVLSLCVCQFIILAHFAPNVKCCPLPFCVVFP